MSDTLSPPRFSLVDEPWLPVVHRDRGNVRVSLVEAFEQADDILDLDSVLRVAEVQEVRMMAAIAADAMGPDIWDRLDVPRIVAYLRERAEIFDLGGPTPFAQDHSIFRNPGYATALIKVFHSGAGKPSVFGRLQGHLVHEVPAAEVAEHLLAAIAFDGGGQTNAGPLKPDGKQERSAKAGPLANSIAHLPVGRSLAETILMNLPSDGSPAWSKDPYGESFEMTGSNLSFRIVLSEDGQKVLEAILGRATSLADGKAGNYIGGPAMPRDPALAWTIPTKKGESPRAVGPLPALSGSESLRSRLHRLAAAEEPAVLSRAREVSAQNGWPSPRIRLYSSNGSGTTTPSMISVDEIPMLPRDLRRASSGAVIASLDSAISKIGRRIEGSQRDDFPGGGAVARASFDAAVSGAARDLFHRALADPSMDAIPEDVARVVRSAALAAVDTATSGMEPMDAALRVKAVRREVSKALPAPPDEPDTH